MLIFVGDMMNKTTRVMLVSVVTNIFLAVIKIITGSIYTSGALVSDGIHSLSDLITDLVAIIGGYLALKPADKEHPYGHGKLEYLTSLAIGVMVMFVGGEVIYKGFTEPIVKPSIIVAFISLITILAKLLLSTFIIKKGKKYSNTILIASGKESRTDVLSSVVVLLSALIIQFGGIFRYADKVASIIVGIFILSTGFKILKENVSNVLGEQVTDQKYIDKITSIIKDHKEIKEVKEMTIMKYGSISSLNLTITMTGETSLQEVHDYISHIEQDILDNCSHIKYVHTHVEPVITIDKS